MAENSGIEIATAYVHLVPSAKGMKQNIATAMDAEGAGGESTGSTWGSKFTSAAGAAIIASAAAVASAATAVGKFAAESFNDYADYEQLTGGIETLFKDSSDVVMDYARSAYQTAGMSANQYMELTTAFSASLINSLGGDTAAAAEYSNTAITQMSDNANKMGTSMEMLENAYRGFARGNYTMLDNLQLGYAGTKEGMEELLAAASELSGVNYDISSYADIIDAIQVIQDNMGITGTTAEEASTTLQGSLNMAKSAWQNFLTGMADENSDFDALCTELIDSVMTFLGNAIPRIGTMLPRLVEGISELVQSLIPQIAEFVPVLVPAIIDALTGLVNCIIENLPLFLTAGMQILTALLQGIADNLPTIIQTFVDMIPQFVAALMTNLPALIGAAITLIGAIITGLIQAIPQLLQYAPRIVTTIASGVVRSLSTIVDVGKQVVRGIWEGITNSLSWIKEMIRGWVGDVVDFIKGLFGIHSPSTVMRDQVGVFLAKGIGEGFSDGMDDVRKDMISALPTSADLTANVNYASAASTLTVDKGGIDAAVIYEAVKAGASAANINLNGRTVSRELKEMGVAFA